MLKEWVIGKMTEWHEGPNGGKCPRKSTEECSQYGIGAVRRYGAIIGTIVAAWYVAACRPEPADDGLNCRLGPPNPERWAFMMLFPALIGLHLREALPRPQPGSSPCAGLGLFSALALSIGGNGSPWQEPGKSTGPCSSLRVMVLFVRLALLNGQAPPGSQCGRNDPHGS